MFKGESILKELLDCQHQHGVAGGKQLEAILTELKQINHTNQQMNGRMARLERWILANNQGYPQLPPDAAESEAMAQRGVEPIPITTDRRSA